MRFLYSIVFGVFALFYLPFFIAKGKLGQWRERFGHVPPDAAAALRGAHVLWVHAVSVGEVGLAIGFLDRLRESAPDLRFVITTTTEAGRAVAAKIKKEEDVLLYFPADFRSSIRRFLDAVSPRTVALFETEIWPNLIWELSRRRVPVLILNGRISDHAFGKYKKISFFLKRVLPCVSLVAAQDARMRGRFIALGADPDRTVVTGNVKFDWKPPHGPAPEVQRLQRFCKRPSDFLFVAGSTHEGEEAALFEMYPALKRGCPGFRLLIAPRHLKRLESIEALAARQGLSTRRVSSEEGEFGLAREGEILLLDQMGTLPYLYAAADLAFVGGSLVPTGGHNLVEPAYFEKPILFGPFMENFREMAEEFKKNDAACPVSGAADLEKTIALLFSDRARCQALGKAAKGLVLRHQGATEKNRELLLDAMSRAMERKLVTV